jgi:hypothetical protein
MPAKRKSPVKRRSPKKRGSPAKQNAWVKHVKKTHNEMKRSSPKATFKSALKRASRTYRK